MTDANDEESFKQPIARATENVRKKNKFRWTIDQMSVLRPVQFDESELSLPPHDWDPHAEQNRTQHSAIEQFWSKNAQIVPSPDVAAHASSKRARRHIDHSHQTHSPSIENETSHSSPTDQQPYLGQSIVFCSPSFPGLIGGNNSSRPSSTSGVTPSSSNFSSLLVSPTSPKFESTRCLNFDSEDIKQMSPIIDENNEEFEEIEHSLSFGIDANEILADLGEENGGFVRRRSNEENEKSGQDGIVTAIGKGGKAGNSSEGSSGLGTSGSAVGYSWTTLEGMAPPFQIDASPIKPINNE